MRTFLMWLFWHKYLGYKIEWVSVVSGVLSVGNKKKEKMLNTQLFSKVFLTRSSLDSVSLSKEGESASEWTPLLKKSTNVPLSTRGLCLLLFYLFWIFPTIMCDYCNTGFSVQIGLWSQKLYDMANGIVRNQPQFNVHRNVWIMQSFDV